MDQFTYEGEVILGCQEGGFAAPEILLQELSGGEPQGVTAKVRTMLEGERPKTLDEILREQFDPKNINDYGDESVGRLRITVERVDA